jgi:precorrin-4 methylase
MTTRLKARVSAAEEKLAGGGPNNAIRVYFVKGHPTHRAEELLRANGRDLSVPHKIIAFVTWADGAPILTPLVDVTASKPLNLVRRLFRASTVTHQLCVWAPISMRLFD